MNMELDSQKEYQTFVLSALLHDIGKMLQRESRGGYRTAHENTASSFLEANKAKLKNDALYDLPLLKWLVLHHHRNAPSRDDFPKCISFERAQRLLNLLIRADSYSCKERDSELTNEDRRKGEKRLAPLNSIFAQVAIMGRLPDDFLSWRYPLSIPKPFECFPDRLHAFEDSIVRTWNDSFLNDLPDFNKASNFSNMLNLWLNVLSRYCWCIPSDTRYNNSDVSLFDHLRTTASFAACLYKVHFNKIEKGGVKFKKNEFYFVGGDFSGIQNYIFDVTSVGSGGAAKRLRARSLFISLFCEATIHKILDSLDLPVVCSLFSVGGKFLILAPRLDEINQQLNHVKKEIERELLFNHFGRFSFLMPS